MIKTIPQLTMSNPFYTITNALAFCYNIIIGVYQYLSFPKNLFIIKNNTSQEKILESNHNEINLIDSENGPIWF